MAVVGTAMNKDIVKDIKFIDAKNLIVNEELNKCVTVKVDARLVNRQNRICDELIELGYSDIYKILTILLKRTLICLKIVNLNKPLKQNIFSKIFEIPLNVDFLSASTILYSKLTDMIRFISSFELLFEKINEVENKLNDIISDQELNNTLSNKTSRLMQIEGLKQMKISLLTVYNCYLLILKNPQIKEFYIERLEYEQNILEELNVSSNYKELMISKINEL